MRNTLPLLIVLMCLGRTLLGDVLEFKNGDRLTGRVTAMEQRRLTFASQVAGEIGIDINGIRRFSTDGPVAMMLTDGTVVHVRIALYEEGKFLLADPVPATQPATRPAVPATRPASGPTTALGATTAPASAIAATGPTTRLASTAPAGIIRTVPLTQVVRIGPAIPEWKGHVTGGILLTRGNTESDSVQAGFDATRRADRDRMELSGNYSYGHQEDPDTGEQFTSIDNWHARAKNDRFMDARWYLYGVGSLDHDRIADLYLRASPGVGVGYQWVESSRTNINTELGTNWIYERYSHPTNTDDFLALRLAWHVEHKLNDTVTFIHNFEFLPNVTDFGDDVINADAGLRARLTGHLFAEFKLQLNYDSKPAEDKEPTDLRYIANLGYEF